MWVEFVTTCNPAPGEEPDYIMGIKRDLKIDRDFNLS